MTPEPARQSDHTLPTPQAPAPQAGIAARVSALLAMAALAAMTLLTLASVGGRLLGQPVLFAAEVSGYALVAVIFGGLAWTDVGSKHVVITLATDRLAPHWRARLARFVRAASMVFLAWLVWFTLQPVLQDYRLQTRSLAGTGWSMWAVQLLIPVGLLLLLMRLIAHGPRRAPGSPAGR